MNETTKIFSSPVRYTLIFVGFILCAWALSDDLLIGGGPGFGFVQGAVLLAGVVALLGALLPQGYGVGLLVTYISLFGALAVGEVALRAAFAAKFDSAFELNDRYLYGLRPRVFKEFVHLPANGGTSHVYRINTDGFRGDELLERDEISKRVIVYGDSFIHAAFSEYSKTFPEQLERMLKSHEAGEVEVINAGVAGYGPDQIAIRMRSEIKELRPDLILVSIFSGNDFGDLARNKLYKLNVQGAAIPNKPTIDPEIVFQEMLSQRELRIRRLIRSILASARRPSHVRDPETTLQEAFDQHVREYEEFAILGDNVVRELRSDPYSADISLVANQPSALYKIKLMTRVLKDIQKTADALEIPLVFMFIPHPIDVTMGNHESGVVDNLLWPDYDPNKLINTLEQICLPNNMRCVSLLEPFRARGGENLYLKGGDDHWNDSGQQLAAKEVISFLEKNALL
ncbi:MAG: SGNH/GDSL hydrolase family protein [Pseudomonadaceae bacterium]|nr:SGNH/GDSL hydrolase family protein [Pseudomonadaceae bacterium]